MSPFIPLQKRLGLPQTSLQISTRILGRRTAPFPPFLNSQPRPAWFYPKILVLTRARWCRTQACCGAAYACWHRTRCCSPVRSRAPSLPIQNLSRTPNKQGDTELLRTQHNTRTSIIRVNGPLLLCAGAGTAREWLPFLRFASRWPQEGTPLTRAACAPVAGHVRRHTSL